MNVSFINYGITLKYFYAILSFISVNVILNKIMKKNGELIYMNCKSSAELKALAREKLKGRYAIAIGVLLLSGLITLPVTLIAALFYNENNTTSVIIYYVIIIIISLLSTVLGVGLIRFYTNLCRNKNYQVSDIFWGFSNHPDKIIIIAVLISLMGILCYLPAILLVAAYAVTKSISIVLMAIFAFIAGFVLVIMINLNYGLTFYIMSDNFQHSAVEALKACRTMMKGHKGRFFYILISFIGWQLLSLLSCGLSMLWVEPYLFSTVTYFYMDLRGELRETIAKDTNEVIESEHDYHFQ